MTKKTLSAQPKTIGYLRVSTGAQDLDKNKADILRLANQEDLGRVQFVEEKVSGKVAWRGANASNFKSPTIIRAYEISPF